MKKLLQVLTIFSLFYTTGMTIAQATEIDSSKVRTGIDVGEMDQEVVNQDALSMIASRLEYMDKENLIAYITALVEIEEPTETDNQTLITVLDVLLNSTEFEVSTKERKTLNNIVADSKYSDSVKNNFSNQLNIDSEYDELVVEEKEEKEDANNTSKPSTTVIVACVSAIVIFNVGLYLLVNKSKVKLKVNEPK